MKGATLVRLSILIASVMVMLYLAGVWVGLYVPDGRPEGVLGSDIVAFVLSGMLAGWMVTALRRR